MDYITVPDFRARHATPAGDAALGDLITEASADITRHLGMAPQAGVSETFSEPRAMLTLTFAPDPGAVVVRDIERSEDVDASTYFVDGRCVIKTKTDRNWYEDMDVLESRAHFPKRTQVTYTLADLSGTLATCRGVCVALVRLELADKGLLREAIGKYNYQGKDTEVERIRILSRLASITGATPVMFR